MALMQPGDIFMGLDLAAGGHLTHGSPVNMSGRWFKPVPYGVDRTTHRIDMDQVEALAREHKPKMIIAGGSAYARHWDFERFRAICDAVGAFFVVDIAHFAGLVAGGAHPSPFPHAHVVTTTTHKTLRGPRGGMILTNDAELAKKINSAIFPGLQGGPLMHVIAAKAVALHEALTPEFKAYAHAVVANAKALAQPILAAGYKLVTGGTDNHLMLVDLTPRGLTGKAAEAALDRANITCNKNGIPFDPQKPMITSGIRLGSPAATSRGFGTEEFADVGRMVVEVLDGLAANGESGNVAVEAKVRDDVAELTRRFPIYCRRWRRTSTDEFTRTSRLFMKAPRSKAGSWTCAISPRRYWPFGNLVEAASRVVNGDAATTKVQVKTVGAGSFAIGLDVTVAFVQVSSRLSLPDLRQPPRPT